MQHRHSLWSHVAPLLAMTGNHYQLSTVSQPVPYMGEFTLREERGKTLPCGHILIFYLHTTKAARLLSEAGGVFQQ